MIINIRQFLFIGFGGMIGAIGRYSISISFQNSSNGFPFATLITNLIGCLLITFILNQHKIKRMLSREIHTALNVGIIGSFTTFSTVTIEIVTLWKQSLLHALAYIFISFFGGLICCYIGYQLAQRKLVR